jgi:FimV-like protein
LGDIRVDSSLNEPLSAQIDIVGATRDELAALTAKVANRDVFLHYAADRPSFLASATFKVGLDGAGRPVLNVRSSEAFTDPVVSLLVDLRWGNGELIREYPLLLDPPGFASPKRAAPAAGASTDQPASAPREADAAGADLPAVTQEAPARAKPAKPAIETVPTDRTADGATPSPPASGDQGGTTRHTVAPRETLRGIVRHAGASTETRAQRMMIAVFRANPHAFEGNINVMHVGAVLSIPSEDAVMAIDATDAKREVRAQMTAWRLNGRPASARRLAASEQAASAAARAPLSGAGPAQASGSAQVSGSAQAAIATTGHGASDAQATDALKGRVQSLEQALDDLHKQLAQENAALDNLKQQADRAVSPPAQAAGHPASQPPQEAPHAAGNPVPASASSQAIAAAVPAVAASVQTSTTAVQATAAPVQTSAAPLQSTAAPAQASAPPASSGEHPAARVEVMRVAPHEPTPSPADLRAAGKNSGDNKLFATIGLAIAPAVALVVGGVVFVRRRALKSLERSRAPARNDEPMNGDAPPADALPATEAAAAPSRPAEPIKAAVATTFVAPPIARSAAARAPAAASASMEAPAARETAHAPTDQTTQELEIDTELLERSYLDALAIDTLGIDTSDTGKHAAHPAPADTANGRSAVQSRTDETAAYPADDGDFVAHDATGTGLETVALDASELDTVLEDADVHTAILDANKFGPAAAANLNATAVSAPKPKLDYNLTDLDATAEHIHAQHVQMPSALHDHVVVSERRMNIVDVLKAAIERDPQRRDLQMKLLETYYAAAAMNRRAFLDVVVKLSRARDMLTAEDWQQVEKMGEEIAPTDALFLDSSKDDAAAA